jgi:hypothetical protein
VASLFNIAVFVAFSKVKRVASATAIVVSDIINITTIEARILRNCFISTKQFCIKFKNKINCINFLLNISNIILKAITKFISDEI